MAILLNLLVLFYRLLQPVDLFPPTSRGFCDVEGNVWEWVEDHCNGLPGFMSQPFYDDYSSPTFDGIHYNMLVSIHYNMLVGIHYNMLVSVHYNMLVSVHYNMLVSIHYNI